MHQVISFRPAAGVAAALLLASVMLAACGAGAEPEGRDAQANRPGDAAATAPPPADPASTPGTPATPPSSGSPSPSSAPASDAAAAAAVLPQSVTPFPTGLSGVLVFQSDREGRPKIYALDLASGRVRALTTDQRYRDENPRWSPDGTRIVFKSNRAHYEGSTPEPGNPDFDIYTMAADGSDVRRVTTDAANESEPTWAPDGKSVIYSADGDSRGDLYRRWLADGRVERLTRHFVGRAIMPTMSPDGRRVAFGAQTLRAGQFWVYQVHVLDVESKRTTPLEGSGGACWPSWMPTGQGLAYVQLDREPSALERIDLQSGARTPLIRDPKLWSYYPDWSPDGRQVAFAISPAHHEGEDWDLALLDAGQPDKFTKLTTGPGNDRLPDWKPR